MQFSIVVPCFNEEDALPALLSDLGPHLERAVGRDWKVILVDDGSRDRTWEIIQQAHVRDARFCGVALSRNFGHQAAVTCGLAYASGDVVAIMDSDLQDTPEVLCQLYARVSSGECDVCYAVRRRRQASLPKRMGYKAFYWLLHTFSEHPWPQDAGDFSAFNRRVHEAILAMPESIRILRGLRAWVGFKQCEIAVDRPERQHGRSKYGYLRLLALAVTSFSSFSYVPLRVASIVGIGMGFVTVLIGLLFLLNRLLPGFTLLHYYIGASPGTTTIILFLSLVSSMIFFCLGILGEYLGIILREIKARPVAIAAAVVGDLAPHPSSRLVLAALQHPVEVLGFGGGR